MCDEETPEYQDLSPRSKEMQTLANNIIRCKFVQLIPSFSKLRECTCHIFRVLQSWKSSWKRSIR